MVMVIASIQLEVGWENRFIFVHDRLRLIV